MTVTYPTPLALMREIGHGPSNMLACAPRARTRRLLAHAELYERFAPGGRVPATFEILTLTAWAPDESQQKPLRPGSAKRGSPMPSASLSANCGISRRSTCSTSPLPVGRGLG